MFKMLAEGTEQPSLLIEPYISETISSALGPILEFQRDVDDDDYVGDDLNDDDDSEYYADNDDVDDGDVDNDDDDYGFIDCWLAGIQVTSEPATKIPSCYW